MDQLYVGTNTKMYMNRRETVEYIRILREKYQAMPKELVLFIIPSFTSLESAQRELNGSRLLLGAQNMGWEQRGAYTGEISPLMLKETGVELVEIGHSERRHILGETNEQENKKVRCALENGLRVLLCIGETAEEKDAGITDEVLSIQLKEGLREVPGDQSPKLMIAYEPVWAIGVNGVLPETNYVKARHEAIRSVLCNLFGKRGEEIPLLYGGSVNRENAKELIKIPEVDGLFIGRSAWEPTRFCEIIGETYERWRYKGKIF